MTRTPALNDARRVLQRHIRAAPAHRQPQMRALSATAAPVVQRAMADPRHITRPEARLLQRAVGNRGARALLGQRRSGGTPGVVQRQENLWDKVIAPRNEGRRKERVLARKTFTDAEVRKALKSALVNLWVAFQLDKDTLTKMTKGKKYSPTGKGRYTGVPLGKMLDNLLKRLKGNPTDTAFYQDVAAVYSDASKVFKSLIEKRKKNKAGYYFRIVGKAGKMRKVLNKGPVLTNYREKNSIYQRTEQFTHSRGPSSTVLSTLNLARYAYCSKQEMRAIAWGLFAWWRTKNRSFHRYHTFKESMMILNSYLGEEFFEVVPAEPDIGDRPKLEGEQPYLG